MFEKEAEEYLIQNLCKTCLTICENNCPHAESEKRAFNDGAEFGYNKANEWHYVKDGLPKETKKYFIYSKEWGVELGKFFADVGYFECRKNDVIAWKEVVLPELKE